MSVLFSVTVSVSLVAALFLLLKERIAKLYGFQTIYILSFILAVRLIVPYSIQFPDIPRWSMVIPGFVPVVWLTGAVCCLFCQTGKYLYLRKSQLVEETNPN